MTTGLRRSMLGCVVGALLVLIAQAVTWAKTRLPEATGGSQVVSVTGHQVEPGLRALGIALLLLALALLASSGFMRRLAGFLTAVIGVAAASVAIAGRSHAPEALLRHATFTTTSGASGGSANVLWLLAFLGGLIAALAGLATLVYGGRWSTMSAKYDSPNGEVTAASNDALSADPNSELVDDVAWRAIDRGEDPTG